MSSFCVNAIIICANYEIRPSLSFKLGIKISIKIFIFDFKLNFNEVNIIKLFDLFYKKSRA